MRQSWISSSPVRDWSSPLLIPEYKCKAWSAMPQFASLAFLLGCLIVSVNLWLHTGLDQLAQQPESEEMAMNAQLARLPTLYLAHGGGPLPVLGDPTHRGLAQWLKAWPKTVPKPQALLIVSAHWEVRTVGVVLVGTYPTPRQPPHLAPALRCWHCCLQAPVATVTSAPHPDLVYDYYGFEPASYEIKYPAPGHPALAERIREALRWVH